MMIPVAIQILIVLFIHTIADFFLQTKEMAMNKSSSNKALLTHVYIYTIPWLIGLVIFSLNSVLLFIVITFIAHFITDYITSRFTKKFYQDDKMYGFPGFWTTIAIDQFLHIAQLILTYYFIFL
jgi:hypothetical protein